MNRPGEKTTRVSLERRLFLSVLERPTDARGAPVCLLFYAPRIERPGHRSSVVFLSDVDAFGRADGRHVASVGQQLSGVSKTGPKTALVSFMSVPRKRGNRVAMIRVQILNVDATVRCRYRTGCVIERRDERGKNGRADKREKEERLFVSP